MPTAQHTEHFAHTMDDPGERTSSESAERDINNEDQARREVEAILVECRQVALGVPAERWQRYVNENSGQGSNDQFIHLIENIRNSSTEDIAQALFDANSDIASAGAKSWDVWISVQRELVDAQHQLQELFKNEVRPEAEGQFSEELSRMPWDRAELKIWEMITNIPQDSRYASNIFHAAAQRCDAELDRLGQDTDGVLRRDISELLGEIRTAMISWLIDNEDLAVNGNEEKYYELKDLLQSGAPFSKIFGYTARSAESKTDPSDQADPETDASASQKSTAGVRPTLNGQPIRDELWNNMEWRSRYEASQLIGMLERTPDTLLHSHAFLQQLKASVPSGMSTEDFWQQLDQQPPAQQHDMASRVTKLQLLIEELRTMGIPLEKPAASVTSDEHDINGAERRVGESDADKAKDLETQQYTIATEIQALWPHLSAEQRSYDLRSFAKARPFLGDKPNLVGFIDALRKERHEFNDNRPIHKAEPEAEQARWVKEELSQLKRSIIEMLNEKQPGLVKEVFLRTEIAQRAEGRVPGREGQSARPTGDITIRPKEAVGVSVLDEVRLQQLVGQFGTRKSQREIENLLKELQAMPDGTKPIDIQHKLKAGHYDRLSYETMRASGHVVGRERCRLGDNLVLEILRDNKGKTAVGLANVDFNVWPTDRLIASDEGIERTNMSHFEGRYLLKDRTGFGTGIAVNLRTENGDVYVISHTSGGWLLERYPQTGRPVERKLSEEELENLVWRKGSPVMPNLGNNSGMISELSLLYTQSKALAKDRTIQAQLASMPALRGSTGGLSVELAKRRRKHKGFGGRLKNWAKNA